MSGAGDGAVVVVGFRVTGRAVVAYLRQRGDRVVIVEDDPTDERRQQAAALGATFVAQPDRDELRRLLAGSRLVVPSPGIPVRHPVYAAAAAAGVAVHSELELGWERLRDRPAAERPALVAITGTNGKTTVTSLVAAMLVSSGLVAVAAGNIGLPFIDAAALAADVLVAEVSSFQLQYTDAFHPAVSCWLNLAEDHLDWHPTAAHYAAAKARVWARQGPGDTAVVNGEDPAVGAAAADADHGVPAGVEVVTFGLAAGDYHQDSEVLIGPGGVPIVKSSELTRSLPLDVANALAATATARAVGASMEGCRAALRQFTALPHRVELVAERDGSALVRRLEIDDAGIGAGRGGRLRVGGAHRRRPKQRPRPRRLGPGGAPAAGGGRHRRGGGGGRGGVLRAGAGDPGRDHGGGGGGRRPCRGPRRRGAAVAGMRVVRLVPLLRRTGRGVHHLGGGVGRPRFAKQ